MLTAAAPYEPIPGRVTASLRVTPCWRVGVLALMHDGLVDYRVVCPSVCLSVSMLSLVLCEKRRRWVGGGSGVCVCDCVAHRRRRSD